VIADPPLSVGAVQLTVAVVVVMELVARDVGAEGFVVKVVTESGEVAVLVPMVVIVETRNW
jgi:hypothetical protein